MPVYKPSSRRNHCSYHNFRYSVGFRVNGGLLGYHTWLSPRRQRARKHPRDSGSSPDSGIFFCFFRPRACVRAPARVWGPWGLRVRPCVWGALGVCFVCGGLGQGGARVGCVAGLVEGGGLCGFDFFLPRKVRPAPYPRVPRGPGDITRAPRREGQPRRLVTRVPLRHLAFTPRARRRSRMRPMVTTAVS